MGMIDHWHPVLLSKELGARPVAVQVAGQAIALHRAPAGGLAALADCCPHRRMRLSQGEIVGGRLRCGYHGWTFDGEGHGESPGTPRLRACVTPFDVIERHGAVWVKSKDSTPDFPSFDVDGYFPVCALHHRAPAPLELVVDNFCEIEHTPTTHAVFGYDLDRMDQVSVRFEPTETTVRVVNVGPPRWMNPVLRLMIGVRKGYVFNDDWTTYFSPVYSVYDHWWTDAGGSREALVRWRLYIFFVPLDERRTDLLTFAYARSRWPGPAGCLRAFRWLLRRHLDREIRLDLGVLGGLENHDTSLEGMKLSRFDRALGLNRERIARCYRGDGARDSRAG